MKANSAKARRRLRDHLRSQFALFVLVGGTAAAVNFLSRFLFSVWVDYGLAVLFAYLLGMMTAFLLNRLFVFTTATNPLREQIFWFCIINVVAVAQTLLISLLLNDIVFPRIGMQWHSEATAHAIGIMVPIATSFIGHKRLSFRQSKTAPKSILPDR